MSSISVRPYMIDWNRRHSPTLVPVDLYTMGHILVWTRGRVTPVYNGAASKNFHSDF